MTSLSARLGQCLLVTTLAAAPLFAGAEVIFEENFDDQPDWHSAMHSQDRNQFSSTHIIPEGWYSIRQAPVWAPSVGYPDRHESIEILARNSDKARGGVGKSYVSWRDSFDPGWNRWNSESMLSRFFPEGYDQLYVEFYVSFSPNWTPAGTSKMFRTFSWNGGNIHNFFSGGDAGPIFIWDYAHSPSYGVRNRLAFRGGPHGENYNMSDSHVGGLARSLTGSGDVSLNFTSDLLGATLSNEAPVLYDKATGLELTKSSSQIVSHESIFGRSGTWTKIAFFVKMNSAPGVRDGALRQWIDDVLVVETDEVMWVGANSENFMPKWNVVAIGGNDFFNEYPNSQRVEEWYSIDDLVVRSSIPENLEDGLAPPSPPGRVSVD